MQEDKKPDDLISAETVLLLAQMEEMIQRAKLIILDSKYPVAVLDERPQPAEGE